MKQQIKRKKSPTLKKYSKSYLIYGANHSFYKYMILKNFDNLSLEPNHFFLANVFDDLDKVSRLKLPI